MEDFLPIHATLDVGLVCENQQTGPGEPLFPLRVGIQEKVDEHAPLPATIRGVRFGSPRS